MNRYEYENTLRDLLGIPVLEVRDFLPEDNQVYFAGGYTGHGIGLAFNTGKSLVDMMFGREVPKWLSARRFS